MERMTIAVPAGLKTQAERQARRDGVSLAQLVRESVQALISPSKPLKRLDPATDSFFKDTFVATGHGPTDVARNHDKYLAEIMDQELARNGHTKISRPRRRR